VTVTTANLIKTPAWSGPQNVEKGESVLDNKQAMDRFLAGIERRGFHMARIAIGDPDEALDLVQDSMIKLVTKYADKPADEWQPLFFRILKNRIIDHQRRGTVRNRVMAWFGNKQDDEADVYDPVAAAPGPESQQPERQVTSAAAIDSLEVAIAALPERQHQAFVLRTLDGLSVEETAEVMGCSGGSVKTHLSRALRNLRGQLEDYV